MSNGSHDLFEGQAAKGKMVAYYRKLLADKATTPFVLELAKRNLAQLEGGTYSIDWDRLERLYSGEEEQRPRPPLSEVMDKPDTVQDAAPPQAQHTKEKIREELFNGFADAAHEHRQQQIKREQHDPNRAMNEAEDDGIPF